MKLLFGKYDLNISNSEFDVLLQSVLTKVQQSKSKILSGYPLTTTKLFLATDELGYSFIHAEGSDSISGIAYKDDNLSRVYLTKEKDGVFTMYIDGHPTLVEKFGLECNSKTGCITSPYNGGIVILSGDSY